MSTDTPAPAPADARTAQDALDPAGLEDALCAAGDYLNGRRTHHGEPPLTGRETGALLGAIALAIRAYAERTSAPAGLEDAIAAATEAVRDAATAEIATRDARIRELEAEVAILQAADVDPDDTLLTGIGGIPGEGTEIRLRPPEELMKAMVASMVAMLNGAQNYVELELRAAGDPEKYLVRVQRAKGKTPNTLRKEAEQRARTAEARAVELEAERAQLRAHLRDAEDYLSLTHTYPATGGGHDILGADFSCAGCALAKKLKEADRG